MRHLIVLLPLAAAVACAPTDAELTPPNADDAELIATVDHEGATLRFFATDAGVAFVSELSEASEPSPLARLVVAEPTPLEVFTYISDETPPQLLVDHHLNMAEDLGVDDLPRSRAEIGRELIEPAWGSYTYTADCRYSKDHAWFKSAWQGAGANWRWYHSSSAYNTKTTPVASGKAWFVTHLCNYDREGYVWHNISTSDWSSQTRQTVDKGERSLLYGVGEVDYIAWIRTLNAGHGVLGPYRLGAYAR